MTNRNSMHTRSDFGRLSSDLAEVRFVATQVHRRAQLRACAAALVILLGSLLPNTALAQQCRRLGNLAAPLEIWDRPPTFSTAQGATQGIRVAVLAKGSVVYICREITVGFGVSTTNWSQVSYYVGGGWHFGWAQSSSIRVAMNNLPAIAAQGFFPSALAAEEPNTQAPQSSLTMGMAPPESAGAPSAPPGPSSAVSAGILVPELWLWLYLALALIAGICGQTVVDIMSASGSLPLREIGRRTLTALIYAPIVFLAFIQTAQFDIATNKQLVIIVLLAFQAGFFWQKVFERSKLATS